jgi:hypothetical protein
MNDKQEHELVASAKRLLDQATDDLDTTTLAQLQQARQSALARRESRQSWIFRPLPLAGACGSVLTAAALAILLVLHPSDQEEIENSLVADLGIITAEESVEFFEDIEFYQWLSTIEDADNRLSRTHTTVPALDAGFLGQESSTEDNRRTTGDGDAGVSRVI